MRTATNTQTKAKTKYITIWIRINYSEVDYNPS